MAVRKKTPPKQLLAKDVMRKQVLTLDPDMTLQEAANFFIEHQITGAPVVDKRGKLVGVISETDLVRHGQEAAPAREEPVPAYHQSVEKSVLSGFQIEMPDYTRVWEAMTPAVLAVDEETPAREIGRLMLKKHVHRVIVTRTGKLSGIISSLDMLRALLNSR